MKKNEVFDIQLNGADVKAVVVNYTAMGSKTGLYLCYAQNRLLELYEAPDFDEETGEEIMWQYYNGIIVEYCVIPELDAILM
jgi:hypothetical protein